MPLATFMANTTILNHCSNKLEIFWLSEVTSHITELMSTLISLLIFWTPSKDGNTKLSYRATMRSSWTNVSILKKEKPILTNFLASTVGSLSWMKSKKEPFTWNTNLLRSRGWEYLDLPIPLIIAGRLSKSNPRNSKFIGNRFPKI